MPKETPRRSTSTPRRQLGVRRSPITTSRLRWGYRAFIAMSVITVLALAVTWLYQSPFVTVRRIDVAGAETLDTSAVAALSGLRDQNMFQLDTHAAAERLAKLPRVRSATFTKLWPNAVRITIEERKPWGWWEIAGVRYVIDADGVVLDGAPPPEGSPVIVQINTDKRLNYGDTVDASAIALGCELIIDAQRSFGRAIVGLEYDAREGISLLLDGGLRATFGDSRDYDYKVATLFVLMQRAQQDGFALNSVDLRFGDRVAFH